MDPSREPCAFKEKEIMVFTLLLACYPEFDNKWAERIVDNPSHDYDGDQFTENQGDCNDGNENIILPSEFYRDDDGDGFGEESISVLACPGTMVVVDGIHYVPPIERNGQVVFDCDNTNELVNPDMDEKCDLLDNDCDGAVDEDPGFDDPRWYLDADGDGFGNIEYFVNACPDENGNGPAPYVGNYDDCNDLDFYSHPYIDGVEGGVEICDLEGIDENCNGMVNEPTASDSQNWYRDADGDGFGNVLIVQQACFQPEGFVLDNTDCDDTTSLVNPSLDELCDEVDNDCDSLVDEADAIDVVTYYLDVDYDAFGNSQNSLAVCPMYKPMGYVITDGDCDDNDPMQNPIVTEVCNGEDDNCDGQVDESTDGVPALGSPTWYRDGDGDGFGTTLDSVVQCVMPTGYVLTDGDCNDLEYSINPSATEQCTLTIDENCDGDPVYGVPSADLPYWYPDSDGDGYGNPNFVIRLCEQPQNYIGNAEDCNDTDPWVHPENDQLHLDANGTYIDHRERCNGKVDLCENDWNGDLTPPVDEIDDDGDGYVECDLEVNVLLWEDPAAIITAGLDCDDTDPLAYPNATEVCNGVFENCVADEYGILSVPSLEADDDGDGYVECEEWDSSTWEGSPAVIGGDDCNDSSAVTYVGAAPNTDPYACLTDADADGEADRLWSLCPSEMTSEEARWRVHGDATGKYLGWSRGSYGISSGQDADGDGVNDLLFFAKNNNNYGYGDVVVSSSNFDSTVFEFDHLTNMDVVYRDAETTSRSFVPDLDGDGLAEVIAGSYWDWYDGVYRTGVTRLFLSTSVNGLGATELHNSDADIVWYGEVSSGYMDGGPSGDFDGDGLPDLLFTGNAQDSAFTAIDKVYIVRGTSIAAMSGEYNIDTADIQIIGLDTVQFLDIDGDGLDDLLSANVTSSNNYDSNEAYVFLSSTLENNSVLTASDADFTVDINIGYAQMGYTLSAGDVDGDGLEDFLLQRRAGLGGDWVTHLFLGANLDWSTGIVDVVDSDYTFTGATCAYAYQSSCYRSVDFLGDIDGDGLDDILLGWYDSSQQRIHSLFRGSSLDPAAPSMTYQDADYFFEWYQGVAPMGDIDGDGQDEFALANPNSDLYASNDGVIAIFSACEN